MPTPPYLILLHGYGATGADLADIGQMWQTSGLVCDYTTPNAPHPCGGNPFGFEWFPLRDLSLTELRAGVQAATASVEALIQHSGHADNYILGGFSQGAMMALHVGLHTARKPRAILAFSGLLTDTPPQAKADAPRIFLAHGEADPIVPVSGSTQAADALRAANYSVDLHIDPKLEHSISEKGLTAASLCIRT